MWQFAQGCYGIKEACAALNTPVVSGNVSLYNETNGVGVFPTPAIVMVGLNDDATKTLPSSFQKEGASIYLIGDTKSDFGGSLYMKELFGKVEGTLAKLDYDKELKLWNLVIEANKKGYLSAAKDVNVGGIAIALAKMVAKSGKGVTCNVALNDERDIFSESFSRAIVEVSDVSGFETLAKESGLSAVKIGTVGGNSFTCNDISKSVEAIKERYFNRFQEVIEQDI